MDLTKVLVWNVRGLNRKGHRDAVHDIISEFRPEIMCLQETKIENIYDRILLNTLGSEMDQHAALPAQGTRGGILIAWRGTACRALTTRLNTYSISVLFQTVSGQQWWLTGVYGRLIHKFAFLQELRDIRVVCPGPWVLLGDFNLIYRAVDKNNQNLDWAMMGRFRRLLNDLELREIDLIDRKYTWSNE